MTWQPDVLEPGDPRVMAFARKHALESGEPLMDEQLARVLFELHLMCEQARAHQLSTPEGRARIAEQQAVRDDLASWHPTFLAARELPLSAPLPELLAASKRLYGDSGQSSRRDVDMVRLIAEAMVVMEATTPPHVPSAGLQQRLAADDEW